MKMYLQRNVFFCKIIKYKPIFYSQIICISNKNQSKFKIKVIFSPFKLKSGNLEKAILI
jgi:hypothetical protein